MSLQKLFLPYLRSFLSFEQIFLFVCLVLLASLVYSLPINGESDEGNILTVFWILLSLVFSNNFLGFFLSQKHFRAREIFLFTNLTLVMIFSFWLWPTLKLSYFA